MWVGRFRFHDDRIVCGVNVTINGSYVMTAVMSRSCASTQIVCGKHVGYLMLCILNFCSIISSSTNHYYSVAVQFFVCIFHAFIGLLKATDWR